ncbi:MAG: nucleotidyltransferase [Candidatus Altiarchaeota archaeon]|nr:nucleotidyltransferase [Candidatus Altiarchaeota archaeon]
MDIYDRSLEVLKQIIDAQERNNFKIVLVGGWAVYAYNPYMKSRDIDLVVGRKDYWRLKEFLLSFGFSETYGEHLDKKGFVMLYQGDKIEIDVYDETVASFDVNTVIENAIKERIDDKKVDIASITDLTIMKLRSVIDRMGSAKGEKDLSDLLAILDENHKNINWSTVTEIVGKKETSNVVRILLSDIKQTHKMYRLDFKRFQKMRKYFKSIKLM